MRELAHKREVERLWSEKLAVYQQQREAEFAEQNATKEAEAQKQSIIQDQKRLLLEQHAAILQSHNPKASAQYTTGYH